MAAPMREGAPAGGPRPAPAHPANFEYDDNEWDIGIGDLIIDLDADIEKTDERAGGMAARAEPDAQRTALKMKIKRTKPGTKSSEAKHEIVKSNEMNGESKAAQQAQQPAALQPAPPPQATPHGAQPPPQVAPHGAQPPSAALKRGSGYHRRDKAREKHPHASPGPPSAATQPPHPLHPPHDLNGMVRPAPTAPNAPGPPAPAPPATPPKQLETVAKAPPPPVVAKPEPSSKPAAPPAPAPAPAPPPQTQPKPDPEETRREASPAPPPAKKQKIEPKETAEVCVGTSVGTITEPDCLGPCEPGTSVTLEGIVWHETEGGVLVVNVTWRGKTYVGTLLDCTRHDWAPPRFCDSPTEELDARTPKGRGKRGRGAAAPDLANFTETRSSVHSKLRNGGGKGRRAQPSPTPFALPRPDLGKRKPPRAQEEEASTSTPPKAKRAPPPPSSPPPDPVLLECPEPNCSKKYKHANGLKYHRSHAHGSPDDDEKDASSSDVEEPTTEPPSPAPSTPAPVAKSPDKSVKSPEKPEPVPPVSPAPAPPTPPSAPSTPLKPAPLRFTPEEFPPSSPYPSGSTEALPVSPVSAQNFPLTTPNGMPPPHPAPPGPLPTSPTTMQSPAPTLGPILVEQSPRGPPLAPSPQFKVKTTASLMPSDERKPTGSPPDKSPGTLKRPRSRRSPGGSPHPPERSFGREGVQSPAYSDISDDAAPTEDGGPGDGGDKPDAPLHVPPGYGVYQYYGQPPYIVSAPTDISKPKDDAIKSVEPKRLEKDCKQGPEGPPPPQKMLPQHFYPYSYMPPGFPYNVEPNYGPAPPDDKSKDPGGDRSKGSPGPGELGKPPLQPMVKPKSLEPQKDGSKHPNENHQILKESIEMKSQMNPYVYQQRQPHPREEEMRRSYYMSLEQQRRKESGPGPDSGKLATGLPLSGGPKLPPPSGPHKPTQPKETGKEDTKVIIKEEPKPIKQEGQKPTMETTGPPPPPTSQYYLPPYMQPPHYAALPFDPVYRGGINPMLVSGPFGGGWGGVGLPRYHAPEDLSRPPPAPKTLDLLQQHAAATYYPTHKIHELSDHAKSPPGKGPVTPQGPPPAGAVPPGKQPAPADASPKESSRSPPPQRHVHTHHHTHVGLGYPLYPAPYGGAR